jgi:hypothetical protein
MDKLSLNNELAQLDLKNRDFYDELSDEEKKKFGPYIMLKYSANVEGDPDLQEWYLRVTNERVNKGFFDLDKKAQWLACTTVSPGMGKFRHYWLAAKKKDGNNNNKAVKFLAKHFTSMKLDELELMAELNTAKDLKEYARSLGLSDAEIKKELG